MRRVTVAVCLVTLLTAVGALAACYGGRPGVCELQPANVSTARQACLAQLGVR